jgi:hypothetical protein
MKKNKVILLIGVIMLLILLVCALASWIIYDASGFFITREVSCSYDGNVYQDGESFKASDGCNTCFCEEGEVGCTEMACLDDQFDNGEGDMDNEEIEDTDQTNTDPNTQQPSVMQSLCPGWVTVPFPSGDAQFLKDPNWNLNIDASGTDYYYVSMQGDISTVGWPNIGVTRSLNIPASDLTALESYLQSTYTPDSLTPITFGWGPYNGIRMRMDGCSSDDTTCTSQMWDTVEIYFIHNSQIWNISMTDVDATGAMDVYSCFVDSFQLL